MPHTQPKIGGCELQRGRLVLNCRDHPINNNLVNIEPDPEHVKLGMPLKLTTFPIGKDGSGVEAINFGFEPAA